MPFELGRPLGVPNDRHFQGRVVRAALALTSEAFGPVLVDYPEDAPPAHAEDEAWSCMLPQPPAPATATPLEAAEWKLEREIALLRPWHEEALRNGKRTTIGPSGLSPATIDEGARVFARASVGEPYEAPAGASAPLPYLLRLLADDLKAFYIEAAQAQPGSVAASSQELGDWLFHKTALGTALYDTRDRMLKSEDPREQGAARQLVPGRWAQRPE